MSKILVVSYSWTGTCSRLAKLLCNLRPGWQHGEIRLEKPRNGRAGYWRCVLDSALRRKPSIRYEGPPPKEFDAVVLISPIWAFSLAGPMRTFVRTRRSDLPEVAVISVMGGAGASNAVREVEQLMNRACLMNAAFTMQEVEEGNPGARLLDFSETLRAMTEAKRGRTVENLEPQSA